MPAPGRRPSPVKLAFACVILLGTYMSVETGRLVLQKRGKGVAGGGWVSTSDGDPELQAMRTRIRANLRRLDGGSGDVQRAVEETLQPVQEASQRGSGEASTGGGGEEDSGVEERNVDGSGGGGGGGGSAAEERARADPHRGRTPIYTNARDTAYSVLKKNLLHSIVFNATLPAVLDKGPTCTLPDVSSYAKGKKMLHAHKKQRKHEYTPVQYAAKMIELARTQEIEGLQVGYIPNTAIKPVANTMPILDTKGGRFSITKRWGDHTLWKNLKFDPDALYHEQRDSDLHLPNYLPEQPVLWAALIPNAWVSQGNVYTCDYAFTTGACLWEMSQPRPVKKEKASYARVAALCDSWCKGYFHFTHEHLPRLASIYQVLKDDPSVYITVPPNRGYVTSYLTDVLMLKADRLLGSGSVFAKEVIYPQPQTCGNMWTESLMLLRKIVFGLHGLTHTLPRKDNNGGLDGRPFVIVLAERAGGKSGRSRMPTNYEEVKEQLVARYPDVVFESSVNKVRAC